MIRTDIYRPQFHPHLSAEISLLLHIIGLRIGIRRLSEIDIYSAAGPLAWQRFNGNPTRTLPPGASRAAAIRWPVTYICSYVRVQTYILRIMTSSLWLALIHKEVKILEIMK